MEGGGKALYQHCLISECIKCAALAPPGRLRRPGAALCPPLLFTKGLQLKQKVWFISIQTTPGQPASPVTPAEKAARPSKPAGRPSVLASFLGLTLRGPGAREPAEGDGLGAQPEGSFVKTLGC